MMKKQILMFGMFIVLLSGIMLVSAVNTMTRTTSLTQVEPGQSFQVTYDAVGTSGTWGASIVDNVAGGCTFPDGTSQLKTVMLSADGTSKTITVNAPSSEGSCTFTGDYKFGTEAIKDFNDKTVMIIDTGNGNQDECSGSATKCEGTTSFTCSSGNWVNNGLVNGLCGHTDNGGGNGNGGGSGVPSLDFDKVLFKIGDFEVTILYFILFIILIVVFSSVIKR